MKTVMGIVKTNFKQSTLAYFIAGGLMVAAIANVIVSWALGNTGSMEIENFLYLLPILMAIFIPAGHFNKIMNLGGKRVDFFKACIINYVIVAFVVTGASLLIHLIATPLIGHFAYDDISLSLWTAFGFANNNMAVAFFQKFSFLVLLMSLLHTLTLSQGRWYGWVANVLIVAIISVFTPIAPLRAALVWFFNMIIFHSNAFVQIGFCLVLAAGIYTLSLIPTRDKRI